MRAQTDAAKNEGTYGTYTQEPAAAAGHDNKRVATAAAARRGLIPASGPSPSSPARVVQQQQAPAATIPTMAPSMPGDAASLPTLEEDSTRNAGLPIWDAAAVGASSNTRSALSGVPANLRASNNSRPNSGSGAPPATLAVDAEEGAGLLLGRSNRVSPTGSPTSSRPGSADPQQQQQQQAGGRSRPQSASTVVPLVPGSPAGGRSRLAAAATSSSGAPPAQQQQQQQDMEDMVRAMMRQQ